MYSVNLESYQSVRSKFNFNFTCQPRLKLENPSFMVESYPWLVSIFVHIFEDFKQNNRNF